MNKKRIYAGAAAGLLLLFTACGMMGPEPESGPEPDGKAAVRISIGAAGIAGRTVHPTVGLGDVTVWKLWGGKSSDPETLLTDFSGAGTTVYLETGGWHFTLKGYKNDDVILQGSIASQTITLEGTNVLAFTAAPVLDGDGTFKITITLPEGHGITDVKVFQDGTQIDTVTPLADTVVFEDDYAAGDYYFSFRLYNNSDLYGVVSETVQVRAHLRSEKTYTLGREDLNIIYVINYHLNDGQLGGGAANPDYYRSTDAGITLPVPARPGYTFGGWYETSEFSDSPVTDIPQGGTEDKDFYARWTAVSYTVVYDKNAADAMGDTPASVHTYDVSAALTANGFSRTNYTFTGWNTGAAGDGASYANAAEVTNLTTTDGATITLYAQWTGISYTVAYWTNGGDGGSTASSSHVYGTASNLAANGFTRTGYAFSGWAASAGGNVVYTDGESVLNLTATSGATVNLFAKWTPNTYTVEYNRNGGSGTTVSSSHTYDAGRNLTSNGFTRTGHTFTGWNTASDGTGQNYTDGQSVTNLTPINGDTVILYAKWRLVLPFNISVWVNEDDGNILVSDNDVTISKSGSGGKPSGFTATVESGYSGIQWYLKGAPLSGSQGTAQSITIQAADYDNGTYMLGVQVTKNGIPYSTDLRFTVTN